MPKGKVTSAYYFYTAFYSRILPCLCILSTVYKDFGYEVVCTIHRHSGFECKFESKCGIYHLCLTFNLSLHFFAPNLQWVNLMWIKFFVQCRMRWHGVFHTNIFRMRCRCPQDIANTLQASLERQKLKFYFFPQKCLYFLMFITAVCFLFLLKNQIKSIYDFKMFCFRQTYLNPSCFA